jgi:hypothetical protein
MLIFLSGIFLTLQITSVVMGVVDETGASGSKLLYIYQTCARQAYETNISGVRPVWYPYMR